MGVDLKMCTDSTNARSGPGDVRVPLELHSRPCLASANPNFRQEPQIRVWQDPHIHTFTMSKMWEVDPETRSKVSVFTTSQLSL